MLNLSFIFTDAIYALQNDASRLAVVPLPAAVYMMQIDVLNQYRYALDHYLGLTLNEPFLQNSSHGTPYQKWAYFTNEDFEMLSFAIHQLLRYTSRLFHETQYLPRPWNERGKDLKHKSSSYICAVVEIRQNKSIGIRVLEDERLSIFAIRKKLNQERVIAKSNADEPTQYFKIISDATGNELEHPIDIDEFRRITDVIQEDIIPIQDRSILATLREQGDAELAELTSLNKSFGEVCNQFYETRKIAEPFNNLNESYWT
jgi:hypothetical protein